MIRLGHRYKHDAQASASSTYSLAFRACVCANLYVARALIWLMAMLLFSTTTARTDERVFEVVPPDKIAFNYPLSPREGTADFFVIAEKGEARCVIVQSADSSQQSRAAVGALARYLELATRAKFKVVDDDAVVPRGMAAIHVGDTVIGRTVEIDLPKLRYGDERFPNLRGYLVKTVDRRTLVIRGVDEVATNHAIVGFLKLYVGVRQYWPGAPGGLGDVIPGRPSLALPEIEWRDWPYYLSFQMSMKPFGTERPVLDFYRRNGTLPPGENYNRWMPPGRFAKEHPEYYALVNGKRLKPKDSDGAKGWQPCVSNPEVQQAMGNAVLNYFREHPQSAGINFSINDGGGDCTCDDCRALDAPNADYSGGIGISDRYVFLSNRVCEIVGREFPHKRIVYLAYAAAARAPIQVKPHPMLLPVLTTPNTFQRWDEWIKTGAGQLGHYVHHDDMVAIFPKMDVHQHARRILYAVGSGKARTFYMEAHPQWPFADVVPYITSELLWDPRQDVDKLLDDYFDSFYGSAAEPMRDYYATLRQGYERWLAEEGTPHWFGKDMSSYHRNKVMEQFRVLSPEEATRAAAALRKAADAGEDDPTVSQRIQVIQATFEIQKLALERAWAAFRLRDESPASEREARRVIEDARLVYARTAQARKHIEQVLEQPPHDQWRLFRKYSRPMARYEELKSGTPGPQIRSTISTGLYRTEQVLRRELGGEKAAAWWRERRTSETVPDLTSAFKAAEQRALKPEPKNLVADAGFERTAAELTDEVNATLIEIVLTPQQVRQAGIHLTFPDRTPYRCVVTQNKAHSGRYSLMLEHCSRGRFTRHVSAVPGTRYRAGLWFYHDKGAASQYSFTVDARLQDGTYRTLSTLNIPNEPGVWRQYVSEVIAPPTATNIFLRLYASNQAADARCWIDDLLLDSNQ